MKVKILQKILVYIVFFVFNSYCKSQFNTLTPLVAKKESTTNVFEIQKSQNYIEPEENNVKSKKRVRKKSSKVSIKNDIDSLKSVIMKLSTGKENTLNYKKIEDSLISLMKLKLSNENYQSDQIKKYDFLEDLPIKKNSSKIFMPLNRKLNVTSNFGGRVHPILGTRRMHTGIDLSAHYENVVSVLDGIVTASGWDAKGGGNYIKVTHSGRFETSYLHLSDVYYKTGDFVKAGWIIARSGNTGSSTAPHLHFSVKEFGQYINPINFLNDLIKVNNLIAISYEQQ